MFVQGGNTWGGSTWGAVIGLFLHRNFLRQGGQCVPVTVGVGEWLSARIDTVLHLFSDLKLEGINAE